MKIAGLAMPSINGWFFPYLPKYGESHAAWKHRLFRMRRSQNIGKAIQKREDVLDLPLDEQIKRQAQRLGTLKNPFGKLKEEEYLSSPSVAQVQKAEYLSSRFYLNNFYHQMKKLRTFGPVRKFRVDYQAHCLVRKQKLFDLQQEWREAQFLRKEKMSRVLIRQDNHQVRPLRATLESMAVSHIKEAVRAEGPCCSKFKKEETWLDRYSKIDKIKDKNWLAPTVDNSINHFPPNTNITITRDSYQGYNAHDFHWAPYRQYPEIEELPEGQMDADSGAQGSEDLTVTQHSNVIKIDNTEASIGSALPGGRTNNVYDGLSAASNVISDSVLHDRPLVFWWEKWQSTHTEGTEFCSLSLPKDIFENPIFKNSPNYAILSRHMYWSGDIELTISVNTNIRQYGQLQFSFYYGSEQDRNFNDLRNNIYTNSQRLHGLMSANTHNEVILKIPFEYVFPVMAIHRIKEKGMKHLGILKGLVVVPLTSVPGTPKEATVRISVRLLNNKFSGMVGSQIAEAQMFSLASVIAVNSLLDRNRDAPTVTSPGMPVIPINSSSWCHGTGQSTYNNILRLDPNCTLPYEEGRIPPIDEMKIDYIKKQFGMFKIVEWNTSQQPGEKLFSMDATPLTELVFYPNIKFRNENEYIIPPVAFLTSLFAYWRGSLELRIDVVGATEVSGALAIFYIPRILDREMNFTMNDLFSCPHSIYDIQSNRQINFLIPYVASHMFWPRHATLSLDYPKYDAPGSIAIFVLNQLTMNETVPQNVKLIMYLRGGDDFELAVPCSPSIGLGFTPKVLLPKTISKRFVPLEGYVPTYSSSWRGNLYSKPSDEMERRAIALIHGGFPQFKNFTGFPKTNGLNMPTLRYGDVTDHVTLFRSVGFKFSEDFYIGHIETNMTKAEVKINVTVKDVGLKSFTDKATHLHFFQQDGYIYAMPVTSKASPYFLTLITVYESSDTTLTPQQFYTIILAMVLNVDPVTIEKIEIPSSNWWTPISFYCSVVYPVPPQIRAEAGDEKENLSAPVAAPQKSASSSASKMVFGEQFLDLKDYCRRFQLYASDSLKISKLLSTSSWRTIVIRFPLAPQGLELNLGNPASPNEYWNRTREGPIPCIASMYRFFDGSVRLRVAINVRKQSDSASGFHELRGKIFVQHRPNISSKAKSVIIQSGATLGTEDMELPGYAAYHQFEDLNNVLSVEVPFYQPCLRTYLQQPSQVDLAERFSDLGEIVIGVTVFSFETLKLDYDIYYAWGDDARASCFIGCPPVIDCTNIPALEPNSSAVDGFEILSLAEKPQGEMFSSWFASNEIKDTVNRVSDIVKEIDVKDIQDIKDTSTKIKDFTEGISTMIGESKSFWENTQDKINKWVSVIINAITNFCHCLINFNLKTLGISILSFLVQLKLVSFSCTDKIVSSLTNLFSYFTRSASTQPNLGAQLVQGEMDAITEELQKEKDHVTCAYVSSLIAGVAALFSFTPKICNRTVKSISDILFEGISKFSFTANHLFTFIKNNLIAIKQIGEWLFSTHPTIRKMGFLKDHSDLYEWAQKVIEYTDPRKENIIFTNSRKASEVYALAGQAGVLNIKMLDLNLTGSQSQILQQLIKKITDLRDRLARTHTAPPVRFEPFVFELTGTTGIGKSELLKRLPYELFNSANLKHEGELIYHRALGNAYWNGLRNQPVCTIDEKFPIDSPEFCGVQLAELFQLKSSCIFNPPMADIPDKNIRYNPLIVQYSSNDPFPQLNGVRDKHAIYRRRDVLIKVEVKESIRVNCGVHATYMSIKNSGHLPSGDFAHLDFFIHQDPIRGTNARNEWGDPLSYEQFKTELCKRFKEFFVLEEKKYRAELCRMHTVLPPEGEEGSLTDLFSYKWIDEVESRSPNLDTTESTFKKNFQDLRPFRVNYEIYKLKIQQLVLEYLNAEQSEVNKIQEQIDKLEASGSCNISISDKCKNLKVQPPSPIDQKLIDNVVNKIEHEAALEEIRARITSLEKAEQEIVRGEDYYNQQTTVAGRYCARTTQIRRTINELEQNYVEAKTAKEIADRVPDETPCGEGPITEKAACVHTILEDLFPYHTNNGVYLPKDNCWEMILEDLDIEGSLNPILENCKTFSDVQNVLKDRKTAAAIVDCGNKLQVKHEKCSSPGCIFTTKEMRRSFISNYFVKTRPDIRGRIEAGLPVADFLPAEYLEGMGVKLQKAQEHEALKSKMSILKDWLKNLKESFYNIKWSKWLKKLSIAISFFAFIGAMFGLWQYYRSPSSEDAALISVCGGLGAQAAIGACNSSKVDESVLDKIKEIVAQGHVSGDNKVNRIPKGRMSIASKAVGALVQGEGISGVLNSDVVEAKLARNTFFLDIKTEGNQRFPGRCLGISGRYALIVDHFMDAWKRITEHRGDTTMIFIPVIDKQVSYITLDLKDIKYYKISNSALSLIELPRSLIPNFKDIRNLFCSKSQHHVLNKLGTVAEMGLTRDYIKFNKVNVKFEQYDDNRIVNVPGSDLWRDFQIFDAYEYEGFSGKGRCGSVLLAHGVQHPIVGMHVAGFPIANKGLAELVYKEMFDKLGENPSPVSPIGEGLISQWWVDSEVIGIGKVPAKYAHQERGKSRIVPSKLQLIDKGDNFKIHSSPAILSKQDKRIKEAPFSPMLEGCKYHGMPLRPFPQRDIEIAKEDLKDLILAKCKPQRQQVGLLTVDEAVGGFTGKPGYEHIEFSTSEGFPFVAFRPTGATNKRWLFNFNEDNKYESTSKLLKDVLDLKWQQRLNNLIPATIFTDCLKDCTIDNEKVLEPGKTRIFSMSSVDFTIQQRQCTLDFVVSYMTCRHNLEHMVGCNPDSIEWTWLSRKLLEVGDNILTGDYSKYGDNLPFEFIEAAFEIIIEWYKFNNCNNEEMFQQLKIMPHEIGHSLHLMFDHLYQCVSGQPSGNSLTVIINSIANSLYMRVAYLNIMRKTAFNSLQDFHKHVRVFSYGDDLIVGLSDSVKELFNAVSLHSFFKSHGLKFTNANKGNEIVPYGTLWEADFLKRGFVLHPTRTMPRVMLAPLKQQSVEETVNWVWAESYNRDDPDSPTFESMSVQVCEDSVRNAFGRGQNYYSQWVNKLKQFWLKQGVNLKVSTWEEMDYKIYDLEMDISPYHKWKVDLSKLKPDDF